LQVPSQGTASGGNLDYTISDFWINPVGNPTFVPTANFSATPTSGTTSTSIQFTDTSTNTPTSRSWNFGDGQTSTAQNPTHTYNAAGTYTVTLTVSNSAGSDSEIKTNYITITAGTQPPVANFSATPRSGNASLTVQFTDLSTNTPTSWDWNFGDGSAHGTTKNPSHQYTSAGTYTITLTATNSGGSDGETKTGYVTVSATPAPVAAFAATPISGNAPLTVQFTNQSTNSTSWSWDFGDGQTSTAQNPSHTYTTPGTYSPSLTANNAAEEWSVSAKPGLIGVSRAGNPISNPYISHIQNGSFESWSGGVPTGWTLKTGYSGQAQSSDCKIGTSSLQISGNTATQYRGWIWQSIAAGENYTKAGCLVKITGLTQGALNIVLWDGTTETVKQFSHNCDWRWVEWRIPYSTAYSGAEIDIYSSGYLNTGANVYIDGLVFSKDYELATTEIEGSNTLSKAVAYNPGAVFSNATIVIKYDILDVPCYEVGTTTCTVDGVPRACTFLSAGQGGQTYIDISSLSNASHSIEISTTYNRVGRYAQDGILVWKGFVWTARDGQGAPQYNRWNPQGIYVDYLDRLHLTIKNVNGVWYSSEADNDIDYLYGKYTWTVDQESLNLDKNTVVGLFTYETDVDEHDIEFSKWEDETKNNTWFSNQPRPVYNAAVYPSEKVLCSIDWQPYGCRYTIVTESGTTLADYTDNDASPTTVAESLAMNLWLWGAPSNQAEIDITIYDFSYEAYRPGYYPWTHREVPIIVDNPSSVYGVQAKVYVPLMDDMESDGKDIRFSDIAGNPISYWIESVTNNIFTIWVKLPARDPKIYLYYGNSSASSASSGTNTFDFFDDFTSFRDTIWDTSGSYNIASSELSLASNATGSNYFKSKNTFSVGKIAEGKIKSSSIRNMGAYFLSFRASVANTSNVGALLYARSDVDNGIYLYNAVGGTYTQIDKVAPTITNYHIYSLMWLNSLDSVSSDGTELGANSTNVYTGDCYLYINGGYAGAGTSATWDWIRVRKIGTTQPRLGIPGWTKSWNTIYIRGPSSTDGVQAKTEISLLQGMSVDGSDLRITDSAANPISFWIESIIDNLFSVWIKLPANATLLYFHYGNSSAASASSGTNTFEFFDDLDAENSTNWTYYGNHSYADSKLTLWNTSSNYGYTVSKATFAYNTIFEAKANYPAGNHFILGYYNVSNNYRAAWMGGFNTDDSSQYCVTQNTSGTTATDDGLDRSGKYNIFQVKFLSTGAHFVVGDYTRRWITTYIPPSPSTIVMASQTNKGNLVVDWVRVRKYVATPPIPYPVYDIEKLDPISIEISRSISGAYAQMSATFGTDLVPHQQERVMYRADGLDITGYLMFYGRVITNTNTLSHMGNTIDMTAADETKCLADQKTLWIMYHTGGGGNLVNSLTSLISQNEINVGYVDVSEEAMIRDSEPTATDYDALQKILAFYTRIARSVYVVDSINGPNQAINIKSPAELDNTPGFPAPITFTWPSNVIADAPQIERNEEENYNKVRLYGTLTSTEATAVCTACIPDCSPIAVSGESRAFYKVNAKETALNDNRIEEKNSTAQIEAIKNLLYFQCNRSTVKMRLMDTVGLELYQRVKFGSGFSEKLQALTNQTQFEYVFTNSHTVDDNYSSYVAVDVSGVPRPKWLRVSSIRYHKDATMQYLDVELITDFIYSSSDPVVPAPYNSYMNVGLMKPKIDTAAKQIKAVVDTTTNSKPAPEYGTVTAVAANGKSATVTTDSGKIITVKTCSASTVGRRVLVTPDCKGNYYISSYA
jgi:PKD repeat protein